MSIKWSKKTDKLPNLQASLKRLDGKAVTVGARGEQAWLGGIHEYGCRITITPKMRAWLHANGLHVKDTTTHITIPERSFLRNGFDEGKDKVIKDTEKLLALVVDGKIDGDKVLEQCGAWLRDSIKDYMVNLNNPSLHPFTVERKHSSNPLIDTGSLLNSIEYEVE
jgi:hypothetical protein